MKTRKQINAIRESIHPIGRAIIASDIFPGTRHDNLLFDAKHAIERNEANLFERVGRAIAPILVAADGVSLKQIAKDAVAFRKHKPSPDPLTVFMSEEVMRSCGTFTNGQGAPWSYRDIKPRLREAGFTDDKATEFRVRELAKMFGRPIQSAGGKWVNKRRRTPAKTRR